jgi:hypothetical protein
LRENDPSFVHSPPPSARWRDHGKEAGSN